MAKRKIAEGCYLWTKRGKLSCWLELDQAKAAAACNNEEVGLVFLGLIPPPWGPPIMAAVKARHAVFCSSVGPEGSFIKFAPLTGPEAGRKRTATNKGKEPSPW